MKDFYSNFLKTYTDKNYQYPTTVSHKGTVIAFAMNRRRIYYTLLNFEQRNLAQSGEEDNSDDNSPIDANAWQENPVELEFADELALVGYGIIPPTSIPLVDVDGKEAEPGNLRIEEIDTFLSRSARLTADAPYQILSDGQYVYVFRQSIASHPIGTLAKNYADMTTTLTLASPLTQSLKAGTVLRIRTTHIKLSADADANQKETELKIENFPLTAQTDDKVFLDDENMLFQTEKSTTSGEPYHYVFLANLAQSLFGTVDSLTLETGTPQTLLEGAILRVGGVHVRVKQQVNQNATRIPINSVNLTANAGDPVDLADTSHYVTDEASGNKLPLVNNSFLVDRFLLAGTPLVLKREVRFQRSRHKYVPQSNKDSLGAEDMDKEAFYEPTQKLDMVRNLRQGCFTVLQLPTQLADIKRWQIFTYNSKTTLLESLNIERSADGLFNTQGTQFYTSPDIEHQNEVFERSPGTCPFTNQPLIPIISKESYAGTALTFSGYYEQVEIVKDDDDVSYFNGSFTVEAWVKISNGTDIKAVIGVGSAEGGLVLAVKDNKTFMQWSSYQTQGTIPLTQDSWYHITWRYEQSSQQQTVFVNGILDGRSSTDSEPFSGDENQVIIGRWHNDNGFVGQIDEIRIWQVARSEEDLKIHKHHRLVGNELGLAGYWRFDEAQGNTAYDLTDNNNNGTLNGADWEPSAAPIGDHPAVRRTIFRLDNRTVKSGLTSLLYYQQEPAATGNASEPKPLKKHARVMLALATNGQDREGNDTDKNYITALDFAVSREGKLAQIPAILSVDFLTEGQWQQKRLHTDPFGLTISGSLLDFTDTNDTPRFFDSAIGQLALYFRGTNDQFYAAYFDTNTAKVQPQLDTKYDVFIGNTSEDLSENPVTTLHVKAGINRDLSANAKLQVGETEVSVISDTPEGATEIGIQPADFSGYRQVAAPTPIDLIDGEEGKLTLMARSADPEMDRVSITVADSAPDFAIFCQVTIKDDEHEPTITETWKRVPREVQQFADVLNGNTQKTFIGQLTEALSPEATQLKLTRTVNSDFYPGDILWVGSSTQIIVESSPAEQEQWAEPLDIKVESITIRAAQGLSVFLEQGSVGLLESEAFTAQEETLTLNTGINRPLQPGDTLQINSSQVTVKAEISQGISEVPIIKSATLIKANQGAPVFKDGTQGEQVGTLGTNWSHHNEQLVLMSDSEATGNLSTGDKLLIGNDGHIRVDVTEEISLAPNKRINIPVANAVLKAAGQPVYLQQVFLGQLDAEWGSDSTELRLLTRGVKRELETDDILLKPDDILKVGSRIQATVTEKTTQEIIITIQINDAKLLPKAPVYVIPYDYQTLASTNRESTDNLQTGSLLLRAIPEQGRVQNTISPITGGATESCRWLEKIPGHALSFNGENQYAGLTDYAKVAQLDGTGHLSLEAWVQPGYKATEQVRLIYHKSDDFRYVLGLQHYVWKSALALDADKYVVVPHHDDIDFDHDQDFTIEAWIKVGDVTANQTTNVIGKKADTRYPYVIEYHESSNSIRASRKHSEGEDPSPTLISETTFNDNQFHHVAFVKNDKMLLLYIDGKKENEKTDNNTNTTKNGSVLYFGTHNNPDFIGEIDEVRIWEIARTEQDIQADMSRQLHGREAGLVGYWHFDGSDARDYSNNDHDGSIHGNPQVVNSPLTAYTFFAGVGDFEGALFKQTLRNDTPTKEQLIIGSSWEHLAAVYYQSYALEFDGEGDYLTCDHNITLDINRDLTIEVFLLPATTGQQGILTKGTLNDGTASNVPYALYLDANKIVFAFEDKEGKTHSYTSSSTVNSNTFHKIAVTRKYQVETKNEGSDDEPEVIVNQWFDIHFYIDGKEAGYHKYEGSDVGTSDQPLEIGKAYGQLGSDFKGIISEIRLWNTADISPENLGTNITDREVGLVSWWRFEENQGNIAYDSKSQNHASIKGADWIKNPDSEASHFTLYHNGVPQQAENMAPKPAWGSSSNFALGAYKSNGTFADYFKGKLDEVRIWKVARTQEQILDNLFTQLTGERQDLIANYLFDEPEEDEVKDHSLLGNHLPLETITQEDFVTSTAPIGNDIAIVRSALGGVSTQFHNTIESRPDVQEYSDTQYDSEGNLIAIMKRCYTYIKNDRWHLVTGYKIGNLVMEWVGQAQADPHIIGYIEGAPPVPSENLTGTSLVMGEPEDYNGASSIELEEPENVNYIYASSRENGFDSSFEAQFRVGLESTQELGLIISSTVADSDIKAGLKGSLDISTSYLNEASVSYGRNTTKLTQQTLSGNWENNNPAGYLNQAVGRRFIPKNVGLALVESDTMDIFALRLTHNNALVGYQMQPNPDIPQDWNLITFALNPTYTKQGSLDGKVGFKEDGSIQPDPHYPNAATYGEWSYFKPIEAYTLKQRIEREQQELETYYQQYSTGENPSLTSADLPKELAARNLVNTYVWTATGGFFSESTAVMESTQESSSGTYSMQGMAGGTLAFEVAIMGIGMDQEYEALFGGHLETIKSKAKETDQSFSINLECAPESDIQLYVNTDEERARYPNINEGNGAYDENGNPILRPGKVDAYRFMTFYLEPTTNNFDDFFNKVVDPIWLEQSGDPNALALLQARQPEDKPKCWRIMHRVTFVSRILPEIEADNIPPMEKAMQELHIQSNWELLKALEPFVRGKTNNCMEFGDAVRDTLRTYMPGLLPYAPRIIIYASLYFGVRNEDTGEVGCQ